MRERRKLKFLTCDRPDILFVFRKKLRNSPVQTTAFFEYLVYSFVSTSENQIFLFCFSYCFFSPVAKPNEFFLDRDTSKKYFPRANWFRRNTILLLLNCFIILCSISPQDDYTVGRLQKINNYRFLDVSKTTFTVSYFKDIIGTF